MSVNRGKGIAPTAASPWTKRERISTLPLHRISESVWRRIAPLLVMSALTIMPAIQRQIKYLIVDGRPPAELASALRHCHSEWLWRGEKAQNSAWQPQIWHATKQHSTSMRFIPMNYWGT